MQRDEIKMSEINRKYFKIGLAVALGIFIGIIFFFGMTFEAEAQTTKTILFENNTYIFDNDANYDKAINVVGIITGSSSLKIIEGISTVNDNFDPLFDIFVAEAPNAVMESSIPESTDNALVIQRSGPQNVNFIDVVFWDSDTNRPLFVINAGDAGRASTLDRSLQVGKDFGSDILDLDYTICENTTLADCDTLLTGADLVVEDDIENFGSLQVHENVNVDGNLSFSGAFGELFDSENETVVTISDANIFFPIAGMQTGDFRNTILNDTNITVLIPGSYLVNYSISFSNANNVNYNSGVMVNGITLGSKGQAHRRLAANDTGNMSATAILDLDTGDNISMAILNESNNSDVIIQSTNFTMTYIGS